MGGGLGCESTIGAGSTFWADLPFPPVELTKPTTLDVANENDLFGLRVLVADDHPVNRRVIEMILGPTGVDVVSVENGAEAVDAALAAPFDVVLMDMQMPIMDGLEATRQIRAAGGPPVVMVSANGLPEHLDAAFESGVVAFITKPISPAILVETIVAVAEDGALSPLDVTAPVSA